MRQWLSRHRLVTLTGPGGVGKTRLALQVGERALADFADGVYFVDLAPVRDASLVISTIAATLHLHESGGLLLTDLLREHLAQRRLLLILDNFEHVCEAGPQVSDLLATAPEVRALVTSRAILHLYGEQVYRLSPPLPVPRLWLPLSSPASRETRRCSFSCCARRRYAPTCAWARGTRRRWPRFVASWMACHWPSSLLEFTT